VLRLDLRDDATLARLANRREVAMYRRPLWIILIAALALMPGLAACDEDEEASTLQGSGNIVTQEIDFADFTAVEAANAFVVDITRSDSFGVTLRVDDNIMDLVDVSKAGDMLRIRLKPRASVTNATLEASVTMPEIDGLKLSGASRVSLSGFSSTDHMDVELSGASTLDGDLEAGSVDLEVSGASRVALEGSADELSVDGSGASTLDLEEFAVDTAGIDLSGASEATVNVGDRIDPVDVSGASRLRYVGDPALGDVTASGGATVNKVGE
jgi:hypothetical protein